MRSLIVSKKKFTQQDFNMKNYTANQKVYQIGIDILTGVCRVEEQSIIYVGETALFVYGKNPEWQLTSEHCLLYSGKDNLKKSEVIESSTSCFWTDTKEKAEGYKKQIDSLLETKKELLKN